MSTCNFLPRPNSLGCAVSRASGLAGVSSAFRISESDGGIDMGISATTGATKSASFISEPVDAGVSNFGDAGVFRISAEGDPGGGEVGLVGGGGFVPDDP